MAGLAILHPHRAAARRARRPVRGGHAVRRSCRPAGSSSPEYAPAPGERVFRMAPLHHHFELGGWERGHDHRPLLDPRRSRRRVRDGPVLRGLHRQWLTPAARRSPAAACWSAASASPGASAARALLAARRPGRWLDRDHRRGRAEAAPARGCRRLGPLDRVPAGVDLVVTSPGLAPDPPAAGRRRRARRPGVGRGRARLAAARRRRRAVAGRHRHQRQDDDGAHARVDPARGRAARRRGRQRRRTDHRRGARRPALRRARRRAVQLSSCTSRRRCAGRRRAAQPRARPPRLARLVRGLRGGQGPVLARRRRDRQRSTTRVVAGCSATPGGARRLHPRRAAARAARRGRRACSSTARSATTDAVLAAVDDVRPAGRAQRRQRAGRGGAGPRRRRRPPTAVAAGLRAFVPDPHRNQPVARRATASTGSTTARPPTRTRRRRRSPPTRASSGSPAASSRASTSTTLVAAHRAAGWPARCCSAPTETLVGRALRRHAPDVPVIDGRQHRRWGDDRGGARRGRARASRRHRAARARRRLLRHVRAATPRAATRSPRPSTRWPDRRAAGPGMTAVDRAARAPALRRTRHRVSRPSAGRQRSSTARTPRCSCCCSPRPACSVFGVLMAVSTTIAASHRRRRHRLDLDPGRQGGEFIALGLPLFWSPMRLPPRAYRLLAYPMLGLALVALFAVLMPGIGVSDQRRPALDRPRPAAAAAVGARKFGMLLWGADLLARKQQLGTLRRARHLFMPLRARLRRSRRAGHARARPGHDAAASC